LDEWRVLVDQEKFPRYRGKGHAPRQKAVKHRDTGSPGKLLGTKETIQMNQKRLYMNQDLETEEGGRAPKKHPREGFIPESDHGGRDLTYVAER